MLFYTKTLPKLKLNDNIGGGGGLQSAVDVDTTSPKLKQLVSISSRHLPTCLFYCGERERAPWL